MFAFGFALVFAVLAVILYVVHKINPKRVRLSAGLWRLASLTFEADGGDDSPKTLRPSLEDRDQASGQAALGDAPTAAEPRQPRTPEGRGLGRAVVRRAVNDGMNAIAIANDA